MSPTPADGATPQAPTAAGSRRRGRQTAWDMVRSLAVVLGAVLVIYLLVPRSDEPIRQPVDVDGAVAVAEAAGAPYAVPDVPDGWEPNSARYREEGLAGDPTWHIGFVIDGDHYAGLEMTRDATDDWVDAATSDGQEVGSVELAGRQWVEMLSDDGNRRSLVLREGGVTTVVTGTALLDELAVLAEAAEEATVEPSAGG